MLRTVMIATLMLAAVLPASAGAQEEVDGRALISYLKGVLMESQDDLAGAYQYYLYALARDPGNAYVMATLGRIALEVGDLDRAKEYGEALRKDAAYAGEGGMILAEADYKLGDSDGAFKILTELRGRSDVPGERVLKFLAKLYIDRKEQDKAREALEEASRLPRADLPIFYELGILSAEAGRNEEAIEALEKAVSLNPDFAEAQLALAQLSAREGRREEAKQAYRETLRVDPFNRTALKELTDMLYDDGGYAEGAALLEPLHRDGKLDDGGEIIYGRFLYKAERTDEALAVFRALIEKLGEKPSLLRVVSEIEVERGDLDTALGHLKRLIEIEPDKFSNYVGLLLIAYGMAPPPSRPAEAVSVSEQDRTAYLEEAAKRVDPQSEEDNYIIGSVLRKAGQLERAEQYLLKAEQLDPKRRSTLLELATVYGHAGNFDEALKRVVLLYSTDPSDPSVANFYGYLLAEKGERLEFAEKLILEALEKEPQNGYYLDSLGWIKYKMGRYREALGILLRATESAKDDAVIWEHLGDTYVKLSDSAKAAEAYRRSLKIDPQGKRVAEKMSKLETSGKLDK